MHRFPCLALAGLATLALGVSALAAQQPTRVRGTIEAVSGSTLTIKSYNGKTIAVMLKPTTKYAWVVSSSLSSIKQGDFIGTAATGPANNMVAQEVVIFPSAMRGTGEGHYPWSMPAAVAANDTGGASHGGATNPSGAPPVKGTMTNGTVASASSGGEGPPVQGTMTNGTVAANSSKSGGKELTITYNKGQKSQIMVPANVPVVRFKPAQKSIVKAGEKAFVVASPPSGGGEATAKFVAVGKKGLMPPM